MDKNLQLKERKRLEIRNCISSLSAKDRLASQIFNIVSSRNVLHSGVFWKLHTKVVSSTGNIHNAIPVTTICDAIKRN